MPRIPFMRIQTRASKKSDKSKSNNADFLKSKPSNKSKASQASKISKLSKNSQIIRPNRHSVGINQPRKIINIGHLGGNSIVDQRSATIISHNLSSSSDPDYIRFNRKINKSELTNQVQQRAMRFYLQHSQQQLIRQRSQFQKVKSQTEKIMMETKIQVHTVVPSFF